MAMSQHSKRAIGSTVPGLRRRATRTAAAAIAIAALSFVTACSGPADSSTPDSTSSGAPKAVKKVSVISDLLTTVYTPLYTAEKLGFFEKHGLDVEITTLQSGSTITQVMESGSADFAASGTITQALAVKQGSDFTAIALEGNTSSELCVSPKWAREHNLTSKSSVEEVFSAFKGATVAVTGAGGTPDLLGQYLIKKYGKLNPATDVKTVALGSAAAISTAFQQGSIDINLASPPQCEANAATGSAEVLLTASQIPIFSELPYAGIYTTGSYLKSNPDVAKDFAAAIVDALQYVHAHPDEVVSKVLKDYFPTTSDATLTEILNKVIIPQMPTDGRMTQAGWKNVNDVLAPVNKAPLDTGEGALWTNKYLPKG